MLRIIASTSAGDAKAYYTTGFSREDYYSQDQEIVGKWGGKGAASLGLGGQVGREAFTALCDNLHPTTLEQLTPRTKANRTVGYDLNFHVPKSVSLVHAFSGDDRIVDVFREAVNETMRELEAKVATRVRRDGVRDQERVTGNLVWAEFIHFTARPVEGQPDPHLHAHVFTFNVTWDDVERRWKAAKFRPIVEQAPYFQAAFHSRLAEKLQGLGYQIERRGMAFEIVGVPASLIAEFSQRTRRIKQVEEELGITDPRQKDRLGAMTREAKAKELRRDELAALWQARVSREDRKALKELIQQARQRQAGRTDPLPAAPPVAPQQTGIPKAGQPTTASPAGFTSAEELAMKYALLHSFEKQSAIPDHALAAAMLRFSVGQVGVERANEVVRSYPGLIRREVDGRRMVTTPQVLAEEQAIVSWARAGRGQARSLVMDHDLEDMELSQEQRDAVQHILRSQDRVTGVLGRSGAGKTRVMKATVMALQDRRHQVLVLTPRAQTAHETLVREGFEKTDTVAQLLTNEALQRDARGAVWWIDEAGQLSVRDMYRLVELADRLNARLVLSGDTRQHGPVERGDALRILQEHGGLELVRIGNIQRQKGVYREAVEHLSEGRTVAGFELLDQMGSVLEIPNERRHERLAKDYLEAIEQRASAIVISPTHAECRRVTQHIRQALQESGRIRKAQSVNILRRLDLTEAERRDARCYRPGFVVEMIRSAPGFAPGERLTVRRAEDHPRGALIVTRADGTAAELAVHRYGARFQVYTPDVIELAPGEPVRITKNGRSADGRYRLHNGSLHTFKGITQEGHLALDNGTKLPRDFCHLDWGYATTSHAAQGTTVDRVFIAESSESFGAASCEQFYVSVSRGRWVCRLYTNDKEMLLEAIQASSQREAALDLVAEEARLPRDRAMELQRAQEWAERNRLEEEDAPEKQIVPRPTPEIVPPGKIQVTYKAIEPKPAPRTRENEPVLEPEIDF